MRKNLLLCFLFVISILFKDSIFANQKNETLVVALGYKPRSFDPQKHTDSSTLAVTKQIYNNLFVLDSNGKIQPELAEKYNELSNGFVNITIKKGIKFHDNQELTAQIVADSLNRNISIPISKVLVESIESIEVVDRYNLKIEQKYATSILLHNFSHSSLAIVKEIKSNDEGINLVGTGAYKIKKWGIGEKVELESFDNYFKGQSSVKNLVFKTIPENTSRFIALETGEVDIAYDISSIDIKSFKDNKNLDFISKPSLGTDFLSINTEKGILSNKNVRNAIKYAINKRAISEVAFENNAEIAHSILAPSVFGINNDLDKNSYNIKKAKQLLADSGIKTPIKLNLWIYEDNSKYQTAQIIQSNLKEIGIDINIEVLELSSFLSFTAQGKHDMLIGLWYASTGDADYGLYPLVHSSSHGSVGNRSFYTNKDVDKLLDDSKIEKDLKVREDNYKQVQTILQNENPIIPLIYKTYNIGLNKRVQGFIFNPNGNHILENTTIN
ncbi:MAG: ABC transporter substrate-binding protein [Cetobacterium sp.]|uniref:ABC transporter substrate-binding protein n=1 Tax=Cetobacterium sp. TaxID=2071632 RepID=UPI002FCA4E1C